ncbi:hypothetical protein RFI_23731, partial [Reticulomyxa filosa]
MIVSTFKSNTDIEMFTKRTVASIICGRKVAKSCLQKKDNSTIYYSTQKFPLPLPSRLLNAIGIFLFSLIIKKFYFDNKICDLICHFDKNKSSRSIKKREKQSSLRVLKKEKKNEYKIKQRFSFFFVRRREKKKKVMSNRIKVTNLPYSFTEKDALSLFGGKSSINDIEIEHDKTKQQSTALIEFGTVRSAQLAAITKDQTIYDDSTIRVYVIWCGKETLATIKISNVSSNLTKDELYDYFIPYGEIVNVTLGELPSGHANESERDTEMVAWISFAEIANALRAQEMDRSIIHGAKDDSGIRVQL